MEIHSRQCHNGLQENFGHSAKLRTRRRRFVVDDFDFVVDVEIAVVDDVAASALATLQKVALTMTMKNADGHFDAPFALHTLVVVVVAPAGTADTDRLDRTHVVASAPDLLDLVADRFHNLVAVDYIVVVAPVVARALAVVVGIVDLARIPVVDYCRVHLDLAVVDHPSKLGLAVEQSVVDAALVVVDNVVAVAVVVAASVLVVVDVDAFVEDASASLLVVAAMLVVSSLVERRDAQPHDRDELFRVVVAVRVVVVEIVASKLRLLALLRRVAKFDVVGWLLLFEVRDDEDAVLGVLRLLSESFQQICVRFQQKRVRWLRVSLPNCVAPQQ